MSRALEIVKAIYSDFSAGDFDKALENLAQDFVWTERVPYTNTWIGDKEGIKAMFARVGETLEWGMDFDDFIDGETMVACVGTYSFRLKPFPPGEPLGTARVTHVWWFNEQGLVSRYEQFVDTLRAHAITRFWV